MKEFFRNIDWTRWGELKKYYDRFGSGHTVSTNDIKQGDVVTFAYHGDYSPNAKVRWVYVLNPNYQKKMHGLDMTLVDPTIMYNLIVKRMDVVKNPQAFYEHPAIKKMVKDTDSYRTYMIEKMSNALRMEFDAKKVEEK